MGDVRQSVDPTATQVDEFSQGASSGEAVSAQNNTNGSHSPGAVNQNPSLVEVRPAGIFGMGLFALNNIARGTRILSEAPFLVVKVDMGPDDDFQEKQVEQFCTAVHALPKDSIKILDDLFCNERAHMDKVDRKKVLKTIHRWNMEHGHLNTRNKVRQADERAMRRYHQFLTNVAKLGPNLTHGQGLFALYSHTNHSCSPNAVPTYNLTIERSTVHASRDIQAGDQIFFDYKSSAFFNREQRQKLFKGWGFTCQCRVCTSPEEPLRQHMVDLNNEYYYQVLPEIVGSGCNLEHPYYRIQNEDAPKPERVLRTMERALKLTNRIAALLRDPTIDIVNADLMYWSARLCLELNNIPRAIKYAQEELNVEEIIIGTDTDHLVKQNVGTKVWLELLKRLVPTRDERCSLFLL